MCSQPMARLCTVRKRQANDNYGFSLSAFKDKAGHFISEVDENNAAFAAGLRHNDFVVEVNGVNVVNKPHSDVVCLIRSNPDMFVMLVVDSEARKVFDKQNISIDSQMQSLIKVEPMVTGKGSFSQTSEAVQTGLSERLNTDLSNVSQSSSQNADHKVIADNGFLDIMAPEKEFDVKQTIVLSSDSTSEIVDSSIPPRGSTTTEVSSSDAHIVHRRQRNQDKHMFHFSEKKALVDQL